MANELQSYLYIDAERMIPIILTGNSVGQKGSKNAPISYLHIMNLEQITNDIRAAAAKAAVFIAEERRKFSPEKVEKRRK